MDVAVSQLYLKSRQKFHRGKRSLLMVVSAVALMGASMPLNVELVSDPTTMTKCERLGEVRSNSLLGGMMTGVGYQKALEGLKKKAAKLGATHLQLLNANAGYAGSNMLGIAFRCSPS
jgi:hypothetical protein